MAYSGHLGVKTEARYEGYFLAMLVNIGRCRAGDNIRLDNNERHAFGCVWYGVVKTFRWFRVALHKLRQSFT